MRNEKIGEMLRHYRKLNALSVSDVAAILHDQYRLNVAEKTIYGWESNQAHPTTDTFVILCELYRISNLADALDLVVDKKEKTKTFRLSNEERLIIEAYRRQPEMQAVVRRVLSLELPKNMKPGTIPTRIIP